MRGRRAWPRLGLACIYSYDPSLPRTLIRTNGMTVLLLLLSLFLVMVVIVHLCYYTCSVVYIVFITVMIDKFHYLIMF